MNRPSSDVAVPPYLPPELIRPTSLAHVRPLGLLLSSGHEDEIFLAAGSMAVFLTGKYAGEAFEQRFAENWNGLAIEHLQVEVDLSSRYSLDQEQPRLLSLLRRDAGLYIQANSKPRGGFPQRIRVEMVLELPPGDQGQTEAFSRWRLLARTGEDQIEVHRHGSDGRERS